MKQHIEANAIALDKELWLKNLFYERFASISATASQVAITKKVLAISPPTHEEQSAPYVQFITEYDFGFEDRVLLLLSLVPHINPGFIDIHGTSKVKEETLSLLGIKGTGHKGTLPTMLTYLYLLAGHCPVDRMRLLERFSKDHVFIREKVLYIEPHFAGDPVYSGKLVIEHKYLLLFTTGELSPLLKIPS